MKFPIIPLEYLNHFVRGYFDGDGTVYLGFRKRPGGKLGLKRLITVFSSGSTRFLNAFSDILAKRIAIRKANINDGHRCFQIKYSLRESIELFKFMYNNVRGLCLERKFDKFEKFFNERPKYRDSEVLEFIG